VRQGLQVSGYYSDDGVTWTLVGTHTPVAEVGYTKVGFCAARDLSDARIPADFEYIRFRQAE